MTVERFGRGSYWIAVSILALPLGLIVLTSLTDATIVGFPVGRLSLRWYAAALSNRDNIRAFWFSTSLAVVSATLSVVAGTWIALAAEMLRPRWRFALFAGTVVPLVTPGIVHAIALRIAIRSIGIAPGPLAVLFGHVVHATPLAAIMIGARLAATPRDLMEAARDLGAGPIAVFAHVRLPWLGATMLAAAVLAGLNSFDDFVRSFFLAGYTPTLPVLIFGRLRSGLTPEINALATLALLSASAIGAVAAWMIGWWRRPGRWSPANGHLPHQEPEDYCDVSMVPRERVKRERRAPRPDRWSGGKSAAAPAPVGGEPLASPPRREVGH